MNLMTVDGYSAKIDYDAETDLFRGEILGLNGGADFYHVENAILTSTIGQSQLM